jgi:hypothetical protein
MAIRPRSARPVRFSGSIPREIDARSDPKKGDRYIVIDRTAKPLRTMRLDAKQNVVGAAEVGRSA